MTTLTMDHHGPSGVASTRRPSTWPPGHAEDLRDPVASSSSLAMIYIVSGPQTRRGTPPPLVGANAIPNCWHTVHALGSLRDAYQLLRSTGRDFCNYLSENTP